MVEVVTVTQDKLLEFISNAKEKIVIAKPSYTKKEILTILNVIKNSNIKNKLYIESGDNAIRYGFGETEAIKIINEHLSVLNVQTEGCIRLSIVVIDNETLIYAQNILFMEKETTDFTFPNGIFGDEEFTNMILKKIDYKEEIIKSIDESVSTNKRVIPFPKCKIEVKNSQEAKRDLENMIASLKINPQIDPSKLNMINFYRNKYKLVKIIREGLKINNKAISLRPFKKLLTDPNEHSKRSWTIFKSEDIKKLENINLFKKELDEIQSKYLQNAGRFGQIIKVENKKELSDEIEQLEKEFLDFVKGETENISKSRFYNKVKSTKKVNVDTSEDINMDTKKNIECFINNSRNQLKGELLETCKYDEGFKNNMYKRDRYLKNKVEKGIIEFEEAKSEFIEKFIVNDLSFPDVDEIIKRINIKVDYYDISDELLNNNKDFQKVIEKLDIQFRDHEKGYVENK